MRISETDDDLDHRFDRDCEREPTLLRHDQRQAIPVIRDTELAAESEVLDTIDRAYHDAQASARTAYRNLFGAEPTQEFVDKVATKLLRGDA